VSEKKDKVFEFADIVILLRGIRDRQEKLATELNQLILRLLEVIDK